MPDFTLASFYNKDANFSSIKFGADAPLLEVELNEMQAIQREKLKDVVKLFVPNGIMGGTFSYTGGVFTLTDAIAIVDGDIVFISNLSLNANNGTTIYLKVWEKEATKDTVLKKLGNEQTATTVPNKIMDVRLNSETSRRFVTVYTLSTTNVDTSAKYLEIGNITSSTFNKTVSEIHSNSKFVTKEELSAIFVEID